MKKYLLFESSEDAMKYVGEGQKKLARVGGLSILLVRSHGQLVAIDNACPHRGHSLMEGNLNHLSEIVCASHAYRFDLQKGEEIEHRCEGLKFYRVLKEDGKTFLEV